MKLTTIITDCTNPYVNLAAEELLTMNGGPDEVILYLWQNANTVVIGKNQNPWRECKVEAMEENGAHLARRLSGGGAVYHDLGNLNFTIIAPQDLYSVPKQNQVILQAVEDLGIHAEVTGRNDLTIDGAKFSGHAYYSSHGRCYHHGTLMMDVNFDDLSNYLQVSTAKLKSHGVQSVRSRVTNLSTYRPENAALSASDAVAVAKKFLAERGYADMAESYHMTRDNVCTINFAWQQEGVLCYPDLIKVSVALDNGMVVGFESAGYLSAHTRRTLPPVQVSREQAQEQVGELMVESHRLAVIPTAGQYEKLCHEFVCSDRSGGQFIIYVNVQSGQQEKILILLEDETGTLAI